jgi:hypothetical protein
MIFLGRESPVRAIAEFAAHYHEERSRQGIGNMMISGAVSHGEGVIDTRERLGGLLKYYYRRAAQPDRVFGHYGLNDRIFISYTDALNIPAYPR